MLVNFMKEHVRKYGFRILVGYSNTEDCLKHETYSLLNRCFSCTTLPSRVEHSGKLDLSK